MPPQLLHIKPSVQMIEWQGRAVDDIVESLDNGRGCLLRGGTGLGKMYIKALAVRKMLELSKLPLPEGSINPFPILWLCPKSVKSQTQTVLQETGIVTSVMLLSYGELKNSSGTALFLDYVTAIEHGAPVINAKWKPEMLPALLVCDERHCLKNQDSLQSRVVSACPQSVKTLDASATPFQRVSDAHSLLLRYGLASKETVNGRLAGIAAPKSPTEYSPSAVERLRTFLDSKRCIVELKNVRFKFPAHTKCTTIYFKTPQQRRRYEIAFEVYAEKMRKLRGEYAPAVEYLVAMQKFQQEAELIRTDELAARIAAQSKTDAVICGSNYLETIRDVWRKLVHTHKISKDRIAYIVGGQTGRERERMRDDFQSGKKDIMLLTVRAGGVGISLHHDRPTTKPRYIVIPPTWSAIDLVQVLGRAHRLTSMSPTVQEILWYGDTIEDDVKKRVELKTKCLSKAVTAREQFVDIFEKAATGEIVEREILQPEEGEKVGEDEHEEFYDGSGLENDDSDNAISDTDNLADTEPTTINLDELPV